MRATPPYKPFPILIAFVIFSNKWWEFQISNNLLILKAITLNFHSSIELVIL